jgi:hypothetical protein
MSIVTQNEALLLRVEDLEHGLFVCILVLKLTFAWVVFCNIYAHWEDIRPHLQFMPRTVFQGYVAFKEIHAACGKFMIPYVFFIIDNVSEGCRAVWVAMYGIFGHNYSVLKNVVRQTYYWAYPYWIYYTNKPVVVSISNFITVNCQLIFTPAGISACMVFMAITYMQVRAAFWLASLIL